MRLLLDTHALLWWLDSPERLTSAATAAIENTRNEVAVSAVNAIEISIKTALGKMTAPGDLEEQIVANAFTELALTVQHGAALRELPLYHRDPFDRMLIAQARCDGLTVITADRRFAAYDVPLLDARA